MTRDEAISKDLALLAKAVEQWENKLDALVAEAVSNGAFAHRDLYFDAAARLTGARTDLTRAAEIMDPKQTSAEDYQ